MIKFSLLRTAGHIGANLATHQIKMTKLKSQLEPSLDLRAIAEELYGPTDETWERKYRSGGINLQRETEALLNLPVWSIANTCRFLEMSYFAIDVVNDAEAMKHVNRLDFANLETVGGNAWTAAIEMMEQGAQGRSAEIKTATPVFNTWYEAVTSGPFLTLIEVGQLAPEGRSCRGKRSFCELHI